MWHTTPGGQHMSGTNPTPYGYKGQWGYYTDGETGLLLLIHRYLDPATGRFLTRDLIGFEGGINLYAYVGNGVVMEIDPRGTAVRFCARPVVGFQGWLGSGGGDIDTWHWFLWTESCGCLGYGPTGAETPSKRINRVGGVIPTCLGNLGDYGVGSVVCWDIGVSVGQERCLCKLARNAAQGYVMCGRIWNNYNPFRQNCQDFVNCLLKKCGLPRRKYTFHGGWGDYDPHPF